MFAAVLLVMQKGWRMSTKWKNSWNRKKKKKNYKKKSLEIKQRKSYF